MKTLRFPRCRALLVLFVAATAAAGAQTTAGQDPRDPLAYSPGGVQKISTGMPVLLSTVHYTVRQDTLSPYDSSRLAWNATETQIAELYNFRWAGAQWTPYDRYSYHFNSSGLNDQTIYEFWNATKGSYVPVSRYSYAHDAAGNKTQLFYEVYNQLNGTYGNGQMIDYGYDAAGNLSMIRQRTWAPATSAWENNTLETMSYNAQGKEQTYMIESWSFNLNAWEKKRQTLSSYDASGTNLVQQEFFSWGGPSLGWVYKSRLKNTLSGGRPVVQVIEDFDVANGQWLPYSQETRSYLTSGELGTNTFAAWYAAGQKYQDQSRDTYSYTADNRIKRVSTRVPVHGSWVVGTGAGEAIYYYKEEAGLGTGKLAGRAADLRISPVPAGNTLSWSFDNATAGAYRASVIDMSGKVVLRTEAELSGNTGQTLDLRSLAPGSYVFRVEGPAGGSVCRLFSIFR